MGNPRTLLVHPPDGHDRIREALEGEGCDVTTVHTATEAIARATSEGFDCLVTEYDLPGDDGVTLLRAVNRTRIDVSQFVFTDAGDESVSQAALDAGADRFLLKNGRESLERLAADVAASEGGPDFQQDVSDHEPADPEIARAIEEAPMGISLSDPDLPDYPLVFVNDAWTEFTGYETEEVLGRNPRFLQGPETDPETVAEVAEAVENESPITVEIRNYRKDGTPFWNELTIAPVHDADGDLVHYVGFQNDVTERKRTEQLAEERAEKLAEEREALGRILERVGGLLGEVSRILVEETSYATIGSRICAEVADEPGYVGAWFGRLSPTGDRLDVVATAGLEEATCDEVPLAESSPAVRDAVESEAIQWIAADHGSREPLDPIANGARRLAVVPLTYGHDRYGFLGVYADGEDALDHRERDLLESVGTTIANGLNAVRTTRILTADQVTELRVEIRDPTAELAQVAAAVDGPVQRRGTTNVADRQSEIYLSVDHPVTTLDPVAELPFVRSARRVFESDDECVFAITVDAPPFVALAERGGAVVDATADSDAVRITVEIAPERDVRGLLDVLRERYDGVELLSRVDREARDRSVNEFAAAVDEQLTQRQRTALTVANLNGYFQWPRPVDGSELAEKMGITRQTFHQHLRAAEAKLVDVYFDA